jgi:hypothetical protein
VLIPERKTKSAEKLVSRLTETFKRREMTSQARSFRKTNIDTIGWFEMVHPSGRMAT